MKKTIYYVCPFIIIPCLCLLCEFLNKRDVLQMNPYIFFAELFIISVIIGNLSPTHRRFDYIMTIIMPLSLFISMFIGGFIDETDLGGRFYMYRAFEVAFQPLALMLYFMMGLTTFFASYKSFRIINIIKSRS